ncbi:hypothetical protein [Kineococcus radiotolerans]|uniref:Uncharacterized protein n=1 Tax=Kineococcus radiotolerans (strain ATCC BAA-149 / DSM 14245 / SRS30216) TaxID=266940 RepID=A6W4E1_KINRD|nr:hypothetical protein [Kineococcus radiotolerans]ABS01680.1 hypothetical protein Krad_0189 [Kineococcus radiotolerans SRS30216 = ATCC BAA-149]
MVQNLTLVGDALWRILLLALLLGAGLPVLFSAGVRAMAHGAGGDAETSHAPGHPIGKVLAIVCFAVVVAAVAIGITYIVASGFGKTLGFEGVVPTIVDK